MKKTISLLLSLVMLFSLFAGLTLTASAADTALEVYTQYGAEGTAIKVKDYSAEELAALAETKAEGYGYYYYKSGAASAVAVTEYVTLDALFTDAGTTFAAGDVLSIMTGEEAYTKGDFSYESLSARGVDEAGNAVPTALAITWNSGSLEDESSFAALVGTAYNSGSLRFVSGMTAEEKEAKSAMGNRMPSGVTRITVVKPETEAPAALEIYTATGEAEAVLSKSYTASELAALAETKAEGYGYYYYKSGAASAVAVTEYVTLDALFTDAGTTFAAGDTLSIMTGEEAYTKGDFSYEGLSARGVDEAGAAVPTALAITWNSGSLEDESSFAALVATAYNSGSLRFVSGMTAEEKEAKSAMGNRMPSGVTRITVVKPEVEAPVVSFADVKESSYYHDAVLWAVTAGITNGTSETTFSPDKDCTRAEMVTFLWRAAGSPAPESVETSFTDLKEGSFYYDAVLWAVAEGITKGTSETTFSPEDTVTRAEAVTFLFRLAKAEAPAEASSYEDVPANAYFADAVAWAAGNEITKGTSETTFSPKDPCLRAQIVTFLYRYSVVK